MKVRGMARLPRALSLLASLVIVAAMSVGFGLVYFNDHAWGAWGDDSAGYIFLAGRMWQQEPLVYIDELAAQGLEFFGDEKLARWLTPTHHQFISPTGWIASKYPIGASLLLLAGAKLMNSAEGFYIITPALAVVNLILVYFLALLLFPKHHYKRSIGLLAAFFLGTASLYYEHALAQPMREIPSMTFVLFMALLLLGGDNIVKKIQSPRARLWSGVVFLLLAGLTFGMALNIRETSIVIFPAVIFFLLLRHGEREFSFKKLFHFITWRWAIVATLIFLFAATIAYIPSIQNTVTISQHKVAFKARDTSSVVLLSNIGHLQTVSWQNIFNNEGKFRPGKGALPHYWGILQNTVPVPYFLVLVAIGIWFYWQESRQRTVFLVLWALGILTIFSLWINPYSRYILPMLPPLILFGTYGVFSLGQHILPRVLAKKALRGVAVAAVLGAFVASYYPVIAQVQENIKNDVYIFKAISQNDLRTLVTLGMGLQKQDKAVLMFSGEWQYGTSETLQAHTGLKTIRFPLEQRFVFNPQQVNDFFEQMLKSGYTIYVWADETSSAQLYEWLAQYEADLTRELDFTFQSDVRIYKIIKHK